MTSFLIYDAKVAVLIAVFYMFYRLMLSRETFHRVNRVVLLLTAIASFVLPLCVITMHETVTMEPLPMMALDDLSIDEAAPVVEPAEETPWWQIALPTLFIIGMLVTLGHTLMSMFRILMLIKRSERYPQPDGTTICVSGNAKVPPFSWMHYIVLNRDDYAEQNAAILAHEQGHIRLKHSWDLLLVDTLTALQWFNPAMWMLRSDLRAIHEYEADGAVLSLGINARQYQYLLITKAASIGGYSLANGISHSTLKNRINMMLHKKSNRSSLLKLLALIPIVGITLAVNAKKVQDVVYTDAPEVTSMEELVNEEILQAEPQPAEAEVAKADEDKTFVAEGFVFDASNDKGPISHVDENNYSPIVGAIVKVIGTKKGTVTGPDGKFKLEVSDGDDLEAMYIGYESVKIVVNKAFSEAGNKYPMPLRKESVTESDDSNPNKVYDVVDEMPKFPGGTGALFEYLARNVRYPAEAEKAGIQGRVIVSFVVEKDGRVSNAKTIKAIHPALDAEALRLINGMPKWTPGKKNGEAARVQYVTPVTFRLQGKDAEFSGSLKYDGDAKGDNQVNEVVVVGYGDQKPTAEGVFVRGTDKDPYIIVDGKPIDGAKLKDIDPKTIDHMEVLKDKAAIEKYGDKAKDGVILITTKKK
jgi:TonB family protein